MEVKQIPMSGMTAIALTSNAGVIRYDPVETGRPGKIISMIFH